MYSNCVLLSVLRLYSMMSSLLSTNSPQLSSCHQEMLMSAQSLLTSWTLLWTLINTSQSLGHHFSIKITQFIKSDTSQELPICKHIILDNHLYLHCYTWPNNAASHVFYFQEKCQCYTADSVLYKASTISFVTSLMSNSLQLILFSQNHILYLSLILLLARSKEQWRE